MIKVNDHLSEILGEGAGGGKGQEQGGIGDQVDAHRKDPRQPRAERDHHDLGDEIGRRDPATVVDARTDGALDVGERGVDDLNIQHGHEGAERRADHGDPGPGRDGRCGDGGGGHRVLLGRVAA